MKTIEPICKNIIKWYNSRSSEKLEQRSKSWGDERRLSVMASCWIIVFLCFRKQLCKILHILPRHIGENGCLLNALRGYVVFFFWGGREDNKKNTYRKNAGGYFLMVVWLTMQIASYTPLKNQFVKNSCIISVSCSCFFSDLILPINPDQGVSS